MTRVKEIPKNIKNLWVFFQYLRLFYFLFKLIQIIYSPLRYSTQHLMFSRPINMNNNFTNIFKNIWGNSNLC